MELGEIGEEAVAAVDEGLDVTIDRALTLSYLPVIGQALATLTAGIAIFDSGDFMKYLHLAEDWLEHAGKLANYKGVKAWHYISQFPSIGITAALIEGGMDVNIGDFDKDGMAGLETLDTIIDFIIFMCAGVSGVAMVGKLFQGNRWAESAVETIKSIPEEIGINWAIGMSLEKIIDAGLGSALEEAIAEQKRPSRIEWPIVRQLLKQHILDDKQTTKILRKLGYPDDQIGWIKQLDENQLALGDLTRLFEYGEISKEDVNKYLKAMGYNATDAAHLVKIYIDKMQTVGTAAYKGTARQLLDEQLITWAQYESILNETFTPKNEIQDDLLTYKLQQQYGRVHLSVSAIRDEYLRGNHDDKAAITNLLTLGYSTTDATELVHIWGLAPVPHHMSAAKVLSYYVAGIIKEPDAVTRLIATNLNSADAHFLVDHPSAAHITNHKLTVALVNQAYQDGVVDETQLPDLYTKVGIKDQDVIDKLVAVQKYKMSRQRRPPKATVPLTSGQILDAFGYGLWQPDTAQSALMDIGYSKDDAYLLLEIKAKGPLNQTGPVYFQNVAQALGFLESLGYQITAPADPRIAAAEAMVEASGYGVMPPAPTIPPTFPVPSGGSGGILGPLSGGS